MKKEIRPTRPDEKRLDETRWQKMRDDKEGKRKIRRD